MRTGHEGHGEMGAVSEGRTTIDEVIRNTKDEEAGALAFTEAAASATSATAEGA